MAIGQEAGDGVTGYAKGTSVPVERSKAEVERLLQRAGATEFQSGWSADFASVVFRINGTRIMVGLPMPPLSEYAHRRGRTAAEAAYAQEQRRRWRCLVLIVKAKLEYIASGLSTVEKEFFSDVVLPNGSTLGDALIPQLEAIQSGRLALPAHKGE